MLFSLKPKEKVFQFVLIYSYKIDPTILFNFVGFMVKIQSKEKVIHSTLDYIFLKKLLNDSVLFKLFRYIFTSTLFRDTKTLEQIAKHFLRSASFLKFCIFHTEIKRLKSTIQVILLISLSACGTDCGITILADSDISCQFNYKGLKPQSIC